MHWEAWFRDIDPDRPESGVRRSIPALVQAPETGWGTLTPREARPVSGKKWTGSGKRHDKRGLKATDVNTDRPAPAPPFRSRGLPVARTSSQQQAWQWGFFLGTETHYAEEP
jgi:hypothetical protein